jgi:hypothetical protein
MGRPTGYAAQDQRQFRPAQNQAIVAFHYAQLTGQARLQVGSQVQ